MATYTVTTAAHKTLTANTVDTVTLGKDFDTVEVHNRGSADITFTVNGPTPTVAGDDMYLVAAGQALKVEPASGSATQVKLISTAATAYSVTGI